MIKGMMFSGVSTFLFAHNANDYDPNIPVLAAVAGWNGSDRLIVHLNGAIYGGVNIRSTWTMPNGIEINISAATTLYGAVDVNANHVYGGAGLTVQREATINNLGAIKGAGGGKGVGASVRLVMVGTNYYCNGGAGGPGKAVTPSLAFTSQTPSAGDYVSPTGGIWAQGATGSAGGDWATSGGAGGGVSYSAGWNNVIYTGFPDGPMPPGNAVTGNSFITWKATGTRIGVIE